MEKMKSGKVKDDDLEHLFDTLRHLTEALESNELTLEESLKTHKEAIEIQIRIRKILNDADRHTVELIKQDETTELFTTTHK